MIDRDQLIEKNEIVAFIEERQGEELKRNGSQLATNYCPVVTHKPGHLCVNVDPDKQVWHCNDCGKGGSVIDWVMHEQNVTNIRAMEILEGGDVNATVAANATTTVAGPNVPPAGPAQEVAAYNYTDENGQLLYQVVRYEPKTFRQRQPKGKEWQWDLDGVTRVLYNLPNVLLSTKVCIAEGEKDADNLNSLGFTGTTNAGGSKNWLEAYADQLKGKDVTVFEDNDPVGKAWADKVVTSLTDKANSVKRIKFTGHKDVSDWLKEIPEAERQVKLTEVMDRTPHCIKPMPIYTIREMEEQFAVNVNDPRKRSFNMKAFSSQFGKISNSVKPGEVVMIVGDTSQGKTAVMQAIAMSAKPLEVLMFELELPLDAMFTRYVQMQRKCYESDIIKGYTDNPTGRYADTFDKLQHVMVCPESGLSMEQVEKLVVKSDLKFGNRPGIVMIDYMGLVGRDYGKTGYEIMAYNANQAKVMAKRTDTIVFMGSQVSRPPNSKKHNSDPQIHDAKGAGELENASNLVLSLNYEREDKLLKMKVLKNTNGPIGAELEFDFEPGIMQITERLTA